LTSRDFFLRLQRRWDATALELAEPPRPDRRGLLAGLPGSRRHHL
jgi:hypothetical protein